jgi:hypothetical protein
MENKEKLVKLFTFLLEDSSLEDLKREKLNITITNYVDKCVKKLVYINSITVQ